MDYCGIKQAGSINAADIVLFVGGADVNPILYGEEPIRGTHFSDPTDKRDLSGFRYAKDKIKVGICRGGQFLNVLSGGKLWQDVDGHCGSHYAKDVFTGEEWRVSSTHHQMFRPGPSGIPIGIARQSKVKRSESQVWQVDGAKNDLHNYWMTDHEVVWYPRTKSLCFQPHPEYDEPADTAIWFKQVLWKCIRGEYTSKRKD